MFRLCVAEWLDSHLAAGTNSFADPAVSLIKFFGQRPSIQPSANRVGAVTGLVSKKRIWVTCMVAG